MLTASSFFIKNEKNKRKANTMNPMINLTNEELEQKIKNLEDLEAQCEKLDIEKEDRDLI